MPDTDYVRHISKLYVGTLDGYTELARGRFEDPADLREARVRLPDGRIEIAAESNLVRADRAEYRRYKLELEAGPPRPVRRA